ncbi:rust resistance kinase Lr10-like isoform X2 [Impatiens glandulifera]|uniref:rust resistance kinase Lr10-like isoform X2 n=1 Tax=Impatiens glandulifera TaxID=253017 RepID=UPI001FB1261F|nr:rust resistance kinase Lr10-like isoform X2 [Impatiens glandulifera]
MELVRFQINGIPLAVHPFMCLLYHLTNMSDLFSLLASRFTLEFYVSERCKNCYNSGGRNCLIGQGQCSNDPKEAFGAIVAAAIPVLFLAFFMRRYLQTGFVGFRIKNQTESYLNVEAFLQNNGSIAPKRYTHSDIKKMTNSFKIKLGQGGYGYVYKGQLKDNTLVAVKILDASKGTGEDFINEIASISRTSHVNVVTLLGYCFEGSKRSLVYEFMPHGSLEKYIYNNIDELTPENSHKLGWETLYQIALGIARGLEYLHRGCNTPILHFDIKPHNILLDANFHPKIADFGLAKLCLKKESKVSLVGTRGTPGFIAPEVFSRSFGVISHKSDVYSYGMMVLEMVGQRTKNINETVDHTSELYFPHWIYKWLEYDKEFNDLLDSEEGKETVRKMIIVGLWCIQINPEERPSITRVVEMLVGSLDLLQVPPKPYLSCVPSLREDANSSSALQSLSMSY